MTFSIRILDLLTIMKRIFNQPFDLFLFTASLLLLFSFVPAEHTIDLHWPDTMYVISVAMFLQVNAIVLLLVWGLCRLLKKFLQRKYLTWIQIVGTLLPVILFVLICLRQEDPETEYDIHTYKDEIKRSGLYVGVLTITFLIGQFSFLLNLLLGIIKPKLQN